LTSEVLTGTGRFEVSPHACFACGELNEHGLHLALHVTGETCWTELTLPADFQGWEGIAHGGIVATILDEVMAWTLASQDAWGVTARMSIEFRRPLPVGARIRGEGRIVERRRRVLTTSGTLFDPASGEVYASAEGLYITVPEARREELKARYGFRLVPEDPPAGEPAASRSAADADGAPEAGGAGPDTASAAGAASAPAAGAPGAAPSGTPAGRAVRDARDAR
jgi:acyl-coenzyme A thioesterase PaaI-like protein